MIETEFQTQSLRFAEGTSGARSPSKSRAKSSLRLKYEAETQVISRKLGDLESIRGQLGLSQRKMAQLLLVDPSAWTRWTKGNDEAPPHIYRMLQWYLALENKYPALDVNFWLNTVAQAPENTEVRFSELAKTFDARLTLATSEMHAVLDRQNRTLRKIVVQTVAVTLLVVGLLALCFGLWLR